MAYTIAVAGKGGVGKTTVCGMMIDALIKGGKGPLLVVDADANSNLKPVSPSARSARRSRRRSSAAIRSPRA